MSVYLGLSVCNFVPSILQIRSCLRTVVMMKGIITYPLSNHLTLTKQLLVLELCLFGNKYLAIQTLKTVRLTASWAVILL